MESISAYYIRSYFIDVFYLKKKRHLVESKLICIIHATLEEDFKVIVIMYHVEVHSCAFFSSEFLNNMN